MPCKHAALALIYAQQMAEMDEPWKLWLGVDHNGNRFELRDHPQWNENFDYIQIPKTIRIGKYDVPEPMREKPEIGSLCWTIYAAYEEMVYCFNWEDRESDNLIFNKGLCHATRENCIIHAKALFSFSEVG